MNVSGLNIKNRNNLRLVYFKSLKKILVSVKKKSRIFTKIYMNSNYQPKSNFIN